MKIVLRKVLILFFMLFALELFPQKVNVSIDEDSEALGYRYRLSEFNYKEYDVNQDLNLILFCQTKDISGDYDRVFIKELKKSLENQVLFKKVHICKIYFDYDQVGLDNLKSFGTTENNEKINCRNAEPSVNFNGVKFSPTAKDISYFETDLSVKFLLYIDVCSKKYDSIKDFITDLLVNNDGRNKDYRCIKRINNPENFVQTLNIMAKVGKMYNELDHKYIQIITSLKDSIRAIERKDCFKKGITIGPEISTLGINLRPPDFKVGLSLILNNYRDFNFGVNTSFHYNLFKGNGSLTLGLSCLRIFTEFTLKTKEPSTFLVQKDAIDVHGDFYDRYIRINNIDEKIKINSNRFIISLNYLTRDYSKQLNKHKDGGWFFGPIGGLDLGTRINYLPSSSNYTFSGKYPKYSGNDTLFNNFNNFGVNYSFDKKTISFLNSGLTALYGVNMGWFYRRWYRDDEKDCKKYRYMISLKAGVVRLLTSYSSPNFDSDFPVSHSDQYNSFLFRSSYYKYSLLSFGITFNYFL